MWFEGSYVAPLRVILGGVRAHTHLAQVRIGARIETAYVKAFEAGEDRWLFNEVAGALIARRVGVGTPPGGLMWVPRTALSHLFPDTAFAHHEGVVPCYASAPVVDGYGIAALSLADAADHVLEVVQKLLLRWPGFASCVVFDEWVANVDRHVNNVLVGPGGRLVPIDHSDCFGGPQQADEDFLTPHAWFRNKLLEHYFVPEALALPVKAGMAHMADALPSRFVECLPELQSLRPWLGEPLGLHWIGWLQTRAKYTAQWVRERVKLLV
jgi:hypothetical protein